MKEEEGSAGGERGEGRGRRGAGLMALVAWRVTGADEAAAVDGR